MGYEPFMSYGSRLLSPIPTYTYMVPTCVTTIYGPDTFSGMAAPDGPGVRKCSGTAESSTG